MTFTETRGRRGPNMIAARTKSSAKASVANGGASPGEGPDSPVPATGSALSPAPGGQLDPSLGSAE